MLDNTNKQALLDAVIASLKKDEARFRYLATGTKTSPEYRMEALSKLQEIRKRLYELSSERRSLHGTAE